jgi:O-antigen/teichoic acid export membrane protein
MRLEKETLSHFLSQFLLSVAGFVATFAIARILGAAGVGIYALGVAILIIAQIPGEGVLRAINKRVSEGAEEGAFASAGLIAAVLSGGVVSVGILALRPYVNRFVGADVAVVLVVILVTSLLTRGVRSVLKGEKKVAVAGWVGAVERVSRAGFQIGLILLGFGVVGLFWGHAAALVVAAFIGMLFVGVDLAVPKRHHFTETFNFGKYAWLTNTKTKSFGWMDTIVLGFFVASSLIGVYEVAWTLASFFALLSKSIEQVLFPEISGLDARGEADRIRTYVNEGLSYAGLLLIPGFFGAAAIGEDILRIYKPVFTQGYYVLLLLISARLAHSYGSQLIFAIEAVNRPQVAFRVNMAFIVANTVLNVLLIWAFGWYGAAVATLVASALLLGLGYYYISTLMEPPSIPYRPVGNQVFSSLLMLGVVVGLESLLPTSHPITLALALIGGVIYFGSLVTLSPQLRIKVSSFV